MSVEKKDLIQKFMHHDKDSGSVEVQIVAISSRIESLLGHSKQNPKDYSTKRGLLKLVNRRRKFLDYIKQNNQEVYFELIKSLGLRK